MTAPLLASPTRKLILLSALYCAEGLPYGFQASALPVLLREQGTSLAAIGYSSALALPWLLKAAWAPLVDRTGWSRIGARTTWIVPMVLGMVACCLVASALMRAPGGAGLGAVCLIVLLMNLCAATLDIAVDGLAVELLAPGELGLGNTAQVVGYKAGMICAGGLLLWLVLGVGGWAGVFGAMACTLVVALGVSLLLLWPEPPPTPEALVARGSFLQLARAIGRALLLPGSGWLILFIVTYKAGERLIDSMFIPYLIDHGLTGAQIGELVGVWGMWASIFGSLAGGLLVKPLGLWRAMALAAVLRTLSLGGPWALAADQIPPWWILGGTFDRAVLSVTCAEHIFAGMLTTTTFAFMMSRVDRSIGATHYTLLASLEVLGKTPSAVFSGKLAESLGYAGTFAVGIGLSLLFLPLLLPLRERQPADGA